MGGGLKCIFMIIGTYTGQYFIDFFLTQKKLLFIFSLFGKSQCVTVSLCDMDMKDSNVAK